ncbi:hypothetical protein OX283_003980 [Flavobacterium sp. SUN052]|uniref:hypothetical protein n=1 Tax=Flavobacterium sp. SUN052 TaxID=3002441 RepID=UPI00237E1882|nr:hypothetical protein [Flavobacterium sp. SUN052]MEC4003803.1 hypothetical protein [Flavobacterium sp. SUN052]
MTKNYSTIAAKKELSISFALSVVFFLVSFIEIFAEYKMNFRLQWITKPFLIPILATLYLITSNSKSQLYLIALLFNWLANIFFISVEFKFLFIASACFLIFRLLIVVKIFKDEKSLGIFPIILGAIPFLFLFLSLINLVYKNINGVELYLVICQTILMTLFGGFSLANFIIKNTLPSKFLLISSLFFGINLFVLGVKYYYIDFTFLKPIAMTFFILGHFVFYKFLVLNENK